MEKERLLFFLEGLARSPKPPDVTLVTNGSLLDRGVVQALSAYPGEFKINLSLHAADAETFAAVTGTRRRDLFSTVVANVRMAAENGLRVKVNHVVLKDYNHTRALEAVELARSIGASTIKFIELLVLPDNPGDYRMFYDIQAVQKQIEQVLQEGDRMDFEKYLELEWELETWKNGKLRVNLGVSKGVATAKVEGVPEAARTLTEMAAAYAGLVEPLREPLPGLMCSAGAA